MLSLLALPLAGCGFTPVYRKGGAAAMLTGNLRFAPIDSRLGFLLREGLEHRFGRPRTDARFDVALDLAITEKELTLIAATGLGRNTLSGKLTVGVIDRESGKKVFSDTLHQTAGYTSSAETLVTEASKKDAETRLVKALGNSLALRLASSAADWAG